MRVRSGAAALVLAATAACSRDPAFVERPGEPWVDALAGCTWTQVDAFGASDTWRYDLQGRLVEHAVEGAVRYRAVSRWDGSCRIEQRWLDIDEDTASRTAPEGYNVQYTQCDGRGAPVWRDDVVESTLGEEWVVSSRRFVNTYDGAGRVERVEQWSEPGGELLDVTEYLWHDDRRPLRVWSTRPSGTTTTTTYWWDHHLLLGVTIDGAGTEIDVARTFERRRLVAEVTTAGGLEVLETDWSYADGERFPYQERRIGATEFGEYDVAVTCP